jgi:hypothetical protein
MNHQINLYHFDAHCDKCAMHLMGYHSRRMVKGERLEAYIARSNLLEVIKKLAADAYDDGEIAAYSKICELLEV